jgi:hypothetical protein
MNINFKWKCHDPWAKCSQGNLEEEKQSLRFMWPVTKSYYKPIASKPMENFLKGNSPVEQ